MEKIYWVLFSLVVIWFASTALLVILIHSVIDFSKINSIYAGAAALCIMYLSMYISWYVTEFILY